MHAHACMYACVCLYARVATADAAMHSSLCMKCFQTHVHTHSHTYTYTYIHKHTRHKHTQTTHTHTSYAGDSQHEDEGDVETPMPKRQRTEVMALGGAFWSSVCEPSLQSASPLSSPSPKPARAASDAAGACSFVNRGTVVSVGGNVGMHRLLVSSVWAFPAVCSSSLVPKSQACPCCSRCGR
jgi:hypothetical protein